MVFAQKILCAFFIFALFMCAASAKAQTVNVSDPNDIAKAKAFFKEAEMNFGLGRFREALVLYQKAFQLVQLPGFHFNMAQCYRNLGEHKEAIFHYKQYLALLPNAPNKNIVEDLIKKCEEAWEKAIKIAPPKIAPPKIAPPKIEPEKTKLTKIQIPTKPIKAPKEDLPLLEEESSSGINSAWFWSGAGISAVLLTAGAITGSIALSKNSFANDPLIVNNPSKKAEQDDAISAGKTFQTTATITFIAGGATALTTAILAFFTDFSGGKTEVSATPLPQGGAIVFAQGRF